MLARMSVRASNLVDARQYIEQAKQEIAAAHTSPLDRIHLEMRLAQALDTPKIQSLP